VYALIIYLRKLDLKTMGLIKEEMAKIIPVNAVTSAS
jgi:hypothetical protein